LEGLVDPDAVMAWSLKAKIIHLYTGNELVQWFSNPRLAHAHLDYPTLVPSLHSATYDSLGHVDEFVTKFWTTWMLFFLIAALASLNRVGNNWQHVSSFVLLGLLLLPFTQAYVQTEGSTLPMVFFTVMGFVQCGIWLVGKDRARLGLGLTFLFGGAMTHFEGFVFLALVAGWILLLPSARPSLKLSLKFWRILAFWGLAALPFICLRLQIPSLHYQSAWASYAVRNPGTTLSNWPGIFMILLARLFVNPDLASWNGEGGRFHWIGKWDGLSSLYNHTTLGLAWLCLLLTVALWFAVPARRQVFIWALAMFVSATVALSGIFTSLITVGGLNEAINLTKDLTGGRYLLPMLLAWFATMITMFFADLPSSASTSGMGATIPSPPASASTPDRSLPMLKDGYWLAVGALLILVLGVFVLPKNESPLPENRLQSAATTISLNGSETNSPENSELQTRMELAIQLDKAGKFAEALQEYREAARLHPNDPMALNNLAWSLAANPEQELRNGKEAVQLASKAVELTGQQQPVFIGTLAAAYSEDGQFAKAVEMAEKARDIALSELQPELAAVNEQLLKLYSAGKAIGLTNGP
jgi:signal transduction histidine kinase